MALAPIPTGSIVSAAVFGGYLLALLVVAAVYVVVTVSQRRNFWVTARWVGRSGMGTLIIDRGLVCVPREPAPACNLRDLLIPGCSFVDETGVTGVGAVDDSQCVHSARHHVVSGCPFSVGGCCCQELATAAP